MSDPLALLLQELKKDSAEEASNLKKKHTSAPKKQNNAQPKSLTVKSKKKNGVCFGAKKKQTAGVYKIEKKKEWKDTINGIQIKNRTADADAMKCRLRKFTLLSVQEANTRASAKSMPSMFAFYAVISEKSNRTSSKGNAYLMMKITDYEGEVTVMIFNAKVRAKYYRWMEGTVVCVGNAKLLDSKKKASTACFIIEDENQMMKIGDAKGFGFCKGKGKDGLRCKRGVNIEKCEYCPFHFLQRRKNIEARRASERKQQQSNASSSSSKQKLDHNRFNAPILRIGSKEALQNEAQKSRARKARMRKTAGRSGAFAPTIKRTASAISNIPTPNPNQLPATTSVRTKPLKQLPSQLKRKAPANFQLPKGKKKKLSKIQSRLNNQPNILGGAGISITRRAAPTFRANVTKKDTRSELARLLGSSSKSDVMSRKSKYEKVGKADRMRKQEVKVACLIQEEREQEYKEKVQSVQGWAFVCYHQGCKLHGIKLEKRNPLCVEKGHFVKHMKLQKHFYVCVACKRKTHTYNKMMPKKSCVSCGGTKFARASAYHTKAAVDIQKEKKKNLQTVSKPTELREYSAQPLKE